MVPRINKTFMVLVILVSILLSFAISTISFNAVPIFWKTITISILTFLITFSTIGNFAINWYDTTVNDNRATVIIRVYAIVSFFIIMAILLILSFITDKLLLMICIPGIFIIVYIMVMFAILKAYTQVK